MRAVSKFVVKVSCTSSSVGASKDCELIVSARPVVGLYISPDTVGSCLDELTYWMGLYVRNVGRAGASYISGM